MPDLPDNQMPNNTPPQEPEPLPTTPLAPEGATPIDNQTVPKPAEQESPILQPPQEEMQETSLPNANNIPEQETPEIDVTEAAKEQTSAPTEGSNQVKDESAPIPSDPTAGPIVGAKESEVFAKKLSFPIKKILILGLVVIVSVGLVFSIVRFVIPKLTNLRGGGALQEATLTYWGLWEPEGVINEVISGWEKDHPNIKVTYAQQSSKEYRERLQSALAKGEGPDIFRFHATWLPMFRNELDSVPTSVMDAATFEKTFYPVAASSLRYGTNYLGIPLEVDTLALFYNQDIFSSAGATPPESWDELRRLAVRLTTRDADGRIQRAGAAIGTTKNIWHWSDILALMMVQNGADLSNPTGQLAEDALTFYLLFSKTDRVWEDTLPDSLMAFSTEKAAMFFGFSWDVFEIERINPNLNFKIVKVPQLPGTDISWASFWAEGVSKKSKNKDAAWEFLKYLSSKETMQKLYEAQSKIRPFGEPYSRVDMADMIKNDPLVAPFIGQASKAKTWYLCSRTFDNGINDAMIKYFEDAVNAGSAEALTTTAQGVNQVLSQYGLSGQTSQ